MSWRQVLGAPAAAVLERARAQHCQSKWRRAHGALWQWVGRMPDGSTWSLNVWRKGREWQGSVAVLEE